MKRYSCTEATRIYRRARRLMAWARQASERGAFDRADRLNAMATADLKKAQQLENAWIAARRVAA